MNCPGITLNLLQISFFLERRHIDKKIRALQEYNSQIIKNRSYFNNDFILGLAKVRGVEKHQIRRSV